MESPLGFGLVAVAAALVTSFWIAPELLAVVMTCSALAVLLWPGRGLVGPDGTSRVEWSEGPPAWQRALAASFMLAVIGVVLAGLRCEWFIDMRVGIPLRYGVATSFALAAVAALKLAPRRLVLTSQALWVETTHLWGRKAWQVVVRWPELQGFELQGDTVVLTLVASGWLRRLRIRHVRRQLQLPPWKRAEALARLRQHAAETQPLPEPPRTGGWRPILLVWGGLMLLTNLPYAWAGLFPPPGQTFVGFHAYVPDMLNYASYARQAEQGAFLLRNQLFFGESAPLLVNLEWWLVGLLSHVLGGRPALSYRLIGAIAGLLLVGLADRNLRQAGLRQSHRAAALALVFTGAGLGGLRYLLHKPLPTCLDLHLAAFPIVELLYNPHFVLGTLLVLVDLELFGRAKDGRGILLAALAGTVHGLVRPYDLGLVIGIRILTVAATCPPRQWWMRSWPLLGLVPVLAYDAWTLLADPSFAIFSNPDMYKPVQSHRYLWAMLPAALLALPGVRRPVGERSPLVRMSLASWMVVGGAIILAPPVDYSMQFLTGLGLPCLMLAGLGLGRLHLAWTWVAVLLMSTTGAVAVWKALNHPDPYAYAARERWDAALVLRASCQKSSRLLAPPDIGLYAAALSDCVPYVSHFSLLDHERKVARLAQFFATDDPARRATLLEHLRITHVAFPGGGSATAAELFGAGTSFRRLAVVGVGANAVALFCRQHDHSGQSADPVARAEAAWLLGSRSGDASTALR